MTEVRLARTFFRRDPVTVARSLLGQRLVSEIDGRRTAGIVVETEAYLGVVDRAAHSYGGRRTPRVATMWGDAGFAYVYFVYGMHHCVNVVAGSAGEPVAVLLRALRPEHGVATMRARRPAASRDRDLCSGPGRLCQALGITREQDGADLVDGADIYMERVRQRALPGRLVEAGPRVGVGYAREWRHEPLRFRIRDDPHVSKSRPQ